MQIETRREARYDPISGIFAGFVQNTKGPRDSEWPLMLNTLLNTKGIPVLPQISDSGEVIIPQGKILVANIGKKKWDVIFDNRGIWYNKDNGSLIEISDSNINTDISILTKIKPDCLYPRWDESLSKWKIDIDRQHEAEQVYWENQVSIFEKMKNCDIRQFLYSQLRYLFNGKNIKTSIDFSTPLLFFDGNILTVDEANQLWMYYMAEGNQDQVDLIKNLIFSAKSYIRKIYP